MPGVLRSFIVPANGETDALADTEYDFPEGDGQVYAFAAVSEAAGLLFDVTFGSRNMMRGGRLSLVAPGVNPILPDNLILRDAALAGEKVRAVLRNTTGAALVGTVLIDLT